MEPACKSLRSCADHAALQSVRRCVTTPAWSASQLDTRWGLGVCDSEVQRHRRSCVCGTYPARSSSSTSQLQLRHQFGIAQPSIIRNHQEGITSVK